MVSCVFLKCMMKVHSVVGCGEKGTDFDAMHSAKSINLRFVDLPNKMYSIGFYEVRIVN